MNVVIRWTQGGEACVRSLGAQAIVLQSTVPWPPGSRIEGILEGAAPALLRVKVHSSRKLAEGAFLIEARPIDLARETRERIEALLRSD